MLKDDLRTPLERRTLKDRLGLSSITPLRIATCSVMAANLAIFAWVGLNHDPLGGQPILTVKMLPGDPVVVASATAVSEPEPLATEEPDEPQQQRQAVRIIKGSGGTAIGTSGARIIEVSSGGKKSRIPGSTKLSALDRQFDVPPEGVPDAQVFHTGSIRNVVRLKSAPIRKLVEKTAFGPLPRISGSSSSTWDAS